MKLNVIMKGDEITVSFYSYKGGTGRSMLVAAAARFLSESGKKVFLLDFDLEAPGLHHKFGKRNKDIRFDLITFLKESAILIDASGGQISKPKLTNFFNYRFEALEIAPISNGESQPIWLLPAGRAPEAEYVRTLSKINWGGLFSTAIQTDGFKLFDVLKDIIIEKYKPDYILIDSRTGITDIGGMALNHMADKLVLLYINNKENLHGLQTLVGLLNLEKVKDNLFLINSRVPPQKVMDQKKLQNIDEAKENQAMQECETIHKELKADLENNYRAKHFTLHNESLLQLVERITYGPNLTPRDSALNIDNLKFFQSIFPDEFKKSIFNCIFPPIENKNEPDGDCLDIQRIIERNYFEESKFPLTDVMTRIFDRKDTIVKTDSSEKIKITCNYLAPKYIDGDDDQANGDKVYKDFVDKVREEMELLLNRDKKYLIKFVEYELPFYNYDVLGIQMNSGLFDFCGDIYFKTETRSALLSVIKLAELKTFCFVTNEETYEFLTDEPEKVLTDNIEIDSHTFIEKLKTKSVLKSKNLSIGLIASHAAASECTKIIERIGCPDILRLKNTENEIIDWFNDTEDVDSLKIAFCDHKISKIIEEASNNLIYSSGRNNLTYDKAIPVGLIYPSGDITWRELMVEAIANVIEKNPTIWQSSNTEDDNVYNKLKKNDLEPLTLKELTENLMLDRPLQKGIAWSEKMKKYFPE